MTDNPYQGQDGYDRAWYDGYAAGHHAGAGAAPTPPSAFPPYELDAQQLSYFQQVYGEGFLAGQQAPINPNVEHQPEEGHNPVAMAGHGFEFVSAFVTGVVERHPVVAAVEVFLAVMVPSGAPKWDEEKGELTTWFSNACREYSWEEFFIPVTWGESDEVPGWHGQVYRDFDGAKNEAEPYLQQGHQVSVVHYRCDSPSVLEEMYLSVQAAAAAQ